MSIRIPTHAKIEMVHKQNEEMGLDFSAARQYIVSEVGTPYVHGAYENLVQALRFLTSTQAKMLRRRGKKLTLVSVPITTY